MTIFEAWKTLAERKILVRAGAAGELTGLRGTVRMEHERYTLDYELG